MEELPLHWQQYYMRLAHKVSDGSKDASSKFGAILVRPDKTVASIGFNGFPKRIPDNPDYLSNPAFRSKKYPRIVHAECNCLDHNRDYDTTGFYLVVNGHPCDRCALRIASTEIAYVYYREVTEFETRWSESITIAKEIFDEAGIKLIRVEDCLSEEADRLLAVFVSLGEIAREQGRGPSEEEVADAYNLLLKLVL